MQQLRGSHDSGFLCSLELDRLSIAARAASVKTGSPEVLMARSRGFSRSSVWRLLPEKPAEASTPDTHRIRIRYNYVGSVIRSASSHELPYSSCCRRPCTSTGRHDGGARNSLSRLSRTLTYVFPSDRKKLCPPVQPGRRAARGEDRLSARRRRPPSAAGGRGQWIAQRGERVRAATGNPNNCCSHARYSLSSLARRRRDRALAGDAPRGRDSGSKGRASWSGCALRRA